MVRSILKLALRKKLTFFYSFIILCSFLNDRYLKVYDLRVSNSYRCYVSICLKFHYVGSIFFHYPLVRVFMCVCSYIYVYRESIYTLIYLL